MRDAYYFISDIHLGLESPEMEKTKEENLVSFLLFIKDTAKIIFIVLVPDQIICALNFTFFASL